MDWAGEQAGVGGCGSEKLGPPGYTDHSAGRGHWAHWLDSSSSRMDGAGGCPAMGDLPVTSGTLDCKTQAGWAKAGRTQGTGPSGRKESTGRPSPTGGGGGLGGVPESLFSEHTMKSESKPQEALSQNLSGSGTPRPVLCFSKGQICSECFLPVSPVGDKMVSLASEGLQLGDRVHRP